MLGLIFSAGLAGMTIGAMALSSKSDSLGRRTMILAAHAVVGVGMVVSGFAQGPEQLAAFRFLVGLGIGSLLASVTALISEFAPPAPRNLAMLVAIAGIRLERCAAGFAAIVVLPSLGWDGFFIAVGMLLRRDDHL